jgi:hypothetical protein
MKNFGKLNSLFLNGSLHSWSSSVHSLSNTLFFFLPSLYFLFFLFPHLHFCVNILCSTMVRCGPSVRLRKLYRQTIFLKYVFFYFFSRLHFCQHFFPDSKKCFDAIVWNLQKWKCFKINKSGHHLLLWSLWVVDHLNITVEFDWLMTFSKVFTKTKNSWTLDHIRQFLYLYFDQTGGTC